MEGGLAFGDAAQKYSNHAGSKASQGKLGRLTKGESLYELQGLNVDSLFFNEETRLKPGAVSRPLKKDSSYVVVRADSCSPTNTPALAEIRRSFGPEVLTKSGALDRAALRNRVFADPPARRRLEAILHPRIRARWQAMVEARAANQSWLCVDIPLLYETGVEAHFDRVIVVACSSATQRRRLLESRGLSESMAEAILAAQLDIRVKINKADHLIWNDSTIASLDGQATLLAEWLRQRHR